MSPFLDSIATIVSVFQQHARGDGDGSGLSRRRMRELIQREFADALVKPHDPQTIEKILQFLEWDGDGEIDFNEFLLLVFRVAKCCFWFLPRAPGNDAEPSREPGEPIPREYRERSQEPRRRELQPRPDRWICREPGSDERTQRPRRADGEGDNRPREPESLREERSRHRRRELEQRELEERSCRAAEPECPESRRPHQSFLEEPLEIDLGECERAEPEERGYGRRTKRERELELAEREREIREELEREERDDLRRKGGTRQRRVDQEWELELEGSRQTKEREEEEATISQRETQERREIREIEADKRRERETLRYERERETSVAAAEADVKVRREIREREPRKELRQRPREREEEEREI
ncbi:TRHY protein, partial [Rhagologus leucostigma]|nr:TRHY protein [Rhagologus leucostigma]